MHRGLAIAYDKIHADVGDHVRQRFIIGAEYFDGRGGGASSGGLRDGVGRGGGEETSSAAQCRHWTGRGCRCCCRGRSGRIDNAAAHTAASSSLLLLTEKECRRRRSRGKQGGGARMEQPQ